MTIEPGGIIGDIQEETIVFTDSNTTQGGSDDEQEETGESGAGTDTPKTASKSGSKSAFKPKKPKRGGLTQVGKDLWAPWTGGKPKTDWSGLEVPKPSSIEPNQYRSTSVSGLSKGQHYRTQGLSSKFSRTKDLMTFQEKVMDHLVDHGLDTITYLTDPGDSSKLVSVLTDHGRFNLKEGVKLRTTYQASTSMSMTMPTRRMPRGSSWTVWMMTLRSNSGKT